LMVTRRAEPDPAFGGTGRMRQSNCPCDPPRRRFSFRAGSWERSDQRTRRSFSATRRRPGRSELRSPAALKASSWTRVRSWRNRGARVQFQRCAKSWPAPYAKRRA